jgi:small subunit ribosomal protein S18
MNHNNNQPVAPKTCFFCANNVNAIDYKDTQLMRRFMNMQAKIVSARRTGNCAKHQRMITRAIKRARTMALLSYTIK